MHLVFKMFEYAARTLIKVRWMYKPWLFNNKMYVGFFPPLWIRDADNPFAIAIPYSRHMYTYTFKDKVILWQHPICTRIWFNHWPTFLFSHRSSDPMWTFLQNINLNLLRTASCVCVWSVKNTKRTIPLAGSMVDCLSYACSAAMCVRISLLLNGQSFNSYMYEYTYDYTTVSL